MLCLPSADGVGGTAADHDFLFLRVAIILRYQGCGVWILASFWGTLFQLAVSSFSWIDRVMENVVDKVGRMFLKCTVKNF